MKPPPLEWLSTALTSFGLIALAEMGDKSQLVCMTLAARHRPLPVFLGAILAFSLLNLLAVLFGVTVAAWLPKTLVAGIVAMLFAVFGVRTLLITATEAEDVPEKSGRSILLSTLMLIFIAEFGDKTQLTVAGLAGATVALPVWLGATAALAVTTAAGILVGRALIQRVSIRLLNHLGGLLFLVLAGLAAGHALRLI